MKKVMEEMAKAPPPPRDLVIYTGAKGAEMIHSAIKKESLKPWYEALVKLFELEIISECKRDNLKAMLDSNDPESVDLAMDLINIKCKEDGNRIQVEGPQLHVDGRSEHQLDFSNQPSIKVQGTLRQGSSSFVMLEEPQKQEVVWPRAGGDLGYMGRGVLARDHARVLVPRSEGTGLDCL